MAKLNYEKASEDYDRARALPLKNLTAWKTRLNPYFGSSELLVLDLGAGTGLFAEAFVEWFGVRVIAVEPSTGMLETAIRERANDRISFIKGDAEHIPVSDGQLDAAWLSTVIHHLADLPAAAREIGRVLKPNAPLLVRSCFPERSKGVSLFRFFPEARRALQRFPTLAEVKDAFSSAGFRFESVEEVPQVTAPSIGAYRHRFDEDIRHTDTTLSVLSDTAYAQGIARLEEAMRLWPNDKPVVDYLTLAAFRRP